MFRFTPLKKYTTILTMSLIGLKIDTSFVLTNQRGVLRVLHNSINGIRCRDAKALIYPSNLAPLESYAKLGTACMSPLLKMVLLIFLKFQLTFEIFRLQSSENHMTNTFTSMNDNLIDHETK